MKAFRVDGGEVAHILMSVLDRGDWLVSRSRYNWVGPTRGFKHATTHPVKAAR
jgi:hypothetical protein